MHNQNHQTTVTTQLKLYFTKKQINLLKIEITKMPSCDPDIL